MNDSVIFKVPNGMSRMNRGSEELMRAVRTAYLAAGKGRFDDSASVGLVITANEPVPDSFSEEARGMALSGKMAPPYTCACDSLAKTVIDALLRCKCYKDRSQVTSYSLIRQYAEEDSVNVIVLSQS